MSRRIIFIILGALLLALLVGLLWYWFFRAAPVQGPQGGQFGSGQERPAGAGADADAGGGVSAVGAESDTAGSPVAGGAGTGGPGTLVGSSNAASPFTPNPGLPEVPGVEWLSGQGGPGGGGGPVTSFVPSNINNLEDSSSGGTVQLVGTLRSGNQGADIGKGLLGHAAAFVGCAALFLVNEAEAQIDKRASDAVALGGGFVFVYDLNLYGSVTSTKYKSIEDCIVKTVARSLIDQLTKSVVNWINSDFNGNPSFVQNFDRFFVNVGDQAAGEFIRGTSLAFLCSPFQLQIRIAIAQSYARRAAPSCTLTSVINNVNAFINGNFSSGGWAGLVQFVGVPTNNPFGAFTYAQIGLATAQSNAIGNARSNVSAGGFIGVQKCTPPGSLNCETVTPGSVIEAQLKKSVVDLPYDSLNLATSFNEVINALVNYTTRKLFSDGLPGLAASPAFANQLTPAEMQAQTSANALIVDLRDRLSVAGQYGSAQQGSIGDIQALQQSIQSLANCWEVASSSTVDAGKRATAQARAADALAAIAAWEQRVAYYNSNITRANSAIGRLQAVQTQLLSSVSAADVAAANAAYQQVLGSGLLISQADVTTAQQDRATLQSTIATRQSQIQSALQECNDFR